VSWLLPTWLEALLLVAALARLEAVQNPMLPIYREREVRFIARQTRARLLVVPSVWRGFGYEALARDVAGGQPDLDVLVADRALPDGDPAALPSFGPGDTDPAQAPVRWVFYTSGTTAEPKGARHTDHSVHAQARAVVCGLEMTESDRLALVFPFTHIGGAGYLYAALMTGSALVLTETFVPDRSIPVLRREGITLGAAGTPFHLAYLDAQRHLPPGERLFPRLRACCGGGSPKPPQLHYQVKEKLGGVGIVSGYGLTEAPVLTMASVHDPDDELARTEGRPAPGVELRLVTTDGRIAGPGEEGELRAKGPMVCRGYVDAALDADAFDADGFLRTGDLARLTDAGNVIIAGRLKDVIIRKGENISAKEVEDLLFAHPAVADVAVVGLPDPRLGERACAVVVPVDVDAPPTLAALFDFLTAAGLMVQKIPEQLEIVDALPRNPAGKVQKGELRERFADVGLPEAAPRPTRA
jgi:cyclohexanecarboxylate-CoA ligase